MQYVEHRSITKGMRVWYKYSESKSPLDGPYIVTNIFHDYRGVNLHLKKKGEQGRNVLLASDEDFGEPIFYTE